MKKQTGPLLVLCSALIMSVGGLMIKTIPWGPMAINSGRNLFAALFTLSYMKISGYKLRCNKTVLACAACVCACCVSYTLAVRHTTAANAIVLEYTSPVFILLYLWVFFRQKPAALDLGACAVVFAGVACCFVSGLSGGGMVGNLLAIFAASMYAVVFMVNMFPGADSFSSYFFSQVMSFAVGLPWLIAEPNGSPASWGAIAFMGVVQVGVAYLLMAKGLEKTKPVAANLICMVEPVANPIWVALFYGERIGALSLVGLAIVLAGLAVYNIASARKVNSAEKAN